jgi:diguanylate cyclase (GGDEF)-like protein
MRIDAINALSTEAIKVEMELARTQARSYFVFRHRLASGETRDVEVHSSPVEVSGRTLLFSIIHDITERKQVEEALQYQALHDTLTDLPNRVLLHDRLNQAIRQGQRDGVPVALLLLDLDGFKEINDTFGHHYGDALLQQLGPRLQSVLRQSDTIGRLDGNTIARLGGDEFAVLLPATDQRGAQKVADKLLGVLQEPITIQGVRLTVGASIGIAVFPQHASDAATLLQRADVAMYAAKQTNGVHMVYDAGYDRYSPQRHALLGDLREAIEYGELTIHYQPQIRRGRAERLEALVRWPHRELGMIPPSEFVPLAEYTGMIGALTVWVLREALERCRKWRELGIEVGVSMNLSARSLADNQLTRTVGRLLGAAHAEPSWLELEITESAVMADPERSMRVLRQLHAAGVRVSIDDFGTGYSSLAYLKRLPVDEVKIDRSFVLDMRRNEEDAIIVRSVIELAHNLGLEVVAEGVEDAATLNLLLGMGCDLVQGHYLCPPIAPEAVEAWLTESWGAA